MTQVIKVWRFGCRPPKEAALAEQLLGQAWLYQDDVRRAYNTSKRSRRSLLLGILETAHVVAYEKHQAATDEYGHVLLFETHRAKEMHKESVNAAVCVARRDRGKLLDCGTYWLIEKAMLAASKAMGATDPIRTRRWSGEGRIGAAVQSRESFPAMEELQDGSVWRHKRVLLTKPDHRGYAELTILVGPLRSERSITWPVKLHRPFPEGAFVKQVAVQRVRRNGHRYRWEALITLAFEEVRHDEDARGVVGIDLGWRKDGELGQRVATWDAEDDDGVLHIDVERSFLHADSLRAIRDDNFNAAKEEVRAREVPGTEHARLWKSKDRMRRIADREETAEGPPTFATSWRGRDNHLEDIEGGTRERAVRRRMEVYRYFADQLAKRYRIVVLEDMPVSDWVGRGETRRRERLRSMAALYELQSCLALRFGPERVHWEDPAYSTRTCASCGVVHPENVGSNAYWTCGGCGASHHQDKGAAENLRKAGERWIDEGNPVRARKRKARKGDEESKYDGIATGDEQHMVVTSRNTLASAAE